jgi:hypothetical protein
MQSRTIALGARLMLAAFLVVLCRAGAAAAERFYISIPGPTLSYPADSQR